MVKESHSLTCPCCGYKTIDEEFEICDVCLWEHEPVQERRLDDDGGPNRVSLRQAQQNFARFGLSMGGPDPLLGSLEERTAVYERDPDWKPFAPIVNG